MKKDNLVIRVYPYYAGNDVAISHPEEIETYELDENGIPFVSGKTNVQEQIQSYADECDINNIILSHLDAGTIDELRANGDNIVDYVGVPTDLNTINAKVKAGKEFYENLPDDKKSLFANYEDFMKKYELLFSKPVENNEEVKTNE